MVKIKLALALTVVSSFLFLMNLLSASEPGYSLLPQEMLDRIEGGDAGWCYPLSGCDVANGRDSITCENPPDPPPTFLYPECPAGTQLGQSCSSFRFYYFPEECNTSYGNMYCFADGFVDAKCHSTWDCRCEDSNGVQQCSNLVRTGLQKIQISTDSVSCNFET